MSEPIKPEDNKDKVVAAAPVAPVAPKVEQGKYKTGSGSETYAQYANAHVQSLTFGSTCYKVTSFKWGQKYVKQEVTQSPNPTGKKRYQLTQSEVTFSGEAILDLTAPPVALMQSGSFVSITYAMNGTVTNLTSAYAVIDDVEFSADTKSSDVIRVTFSGSLGDDYVIS